MLKVDVDICKGPIINLKKLHFCLDHIKNNFLFLGNVLVSFSGAKIQIKNETPSPDVSHLYTVLK